MLRQNGTHLTLQKFTEQAATNQNPVISHQWPGPSGLQASQDSDLDLDSSPNSELVHQPTPGSVRKAVIS